MSDTPEHPYRRHTDNPHQHPAYRRRLDPATVLYARLMSDGYMVAGEVEPDGSWVLRRFCAVGPTALQRLVEVAPDAVSPEVVTAIGRAVTDLLEGRCERVDEDGYPLGSV